MLPLSFYRRVDVVEISRDLLGKFLFVDTGGAKRSAMIVETEAYAGVSDRASHAYGGRRTKRTEVMYSGGGVAYVYLCYGIHHLFNVVTNVEGVPHAVLIRGIIIQTNKQVKAKESQKMKNGTRIDGPGRVSKALGITTADSGTDLTGDKIWIEDRGVIMATNEIEITPRIGIAYAGEDAKLPYRFLYHPGRK